MVSRDADTIVDLLISMAEEAGLVADSLIVDPDESIAFCVGLWRRPGNQSGRMSLAGVVDWCRKYPSRLVIKPSSQREIATVDLADPNSDRLLRCYLDLLASGHTDLCKQTPASPWCSHDHP